MGEPTLVSGEYELVVVIDGQTLTCPVPLSTTPAVAEFPCRLADGSPGGMTFFKVPSSGSPFHLEGDLSEAPSSVGVTVFRDGVEVASAGDDAVAYETYFPNGEGCPPTCRRADDLEVTVP